MNYSRLTAAAALALGLTFPPVTGAQNPPAQRPDAGTQRPDAGMKHPPTAQMDAATPTGKSTTRKPDSAKHPPTSAMDRAAPDEKSPGTRPDPAASGDAQQQRSPGEPRQGN
jgi:hypothetical protein